MWFRKSARRHRQASVGRARGRAARPSLEPLEDRRLLSAGAISGLALEDLTGNGVSPDDVAVVGRTIKLYRDSGDGHFQPALDPLVAQTTTSAGGSYSFTDLSPGLYFVQQVLQIGRA